MALKFTKKAAPQVTADKVVEKSQKLDDGTIEKQIVEETHETDNLVAVPVSGKHAVVHMRAGRTINMGNFESDRIDVGIEYPCEPDKIDETLDYCSGWVNQKIEEMTS